MALDLVRSAAEVVYADLLDRILNRELKPGQMVYEAELARYYQVSKTPAREALLRLVNQGVVEKYPRTGYMVRQVTLKEINDGYYVRALLEGEAAALAAAVIDEETVARLQDMLGPGPAESGYMDSRPTPDPAEAKRPTGAYNKTFHVIIAQSTGNHRLAHLTELTQDYLLRVTAMDPFLSLATDYGWEEHARIVRALAAHDPVAAREAAVAHVEAGKARAIRALGE